MKEHNKWSLENLDFDNEYQTSLTNLSEPYSPKILAVMLDIQETCDGIDNNKAKIFIAQLEKIKRKYKAKEIIISVITQEEKTPREQVVLNILSRNLKKGIKIEPREINTDSYNDKIQFFEDNYIHNIEKNTVWFALIDTKIKANIYKKYQYNRAMLVCMPSQEKTAKYNIMSISTTTPGFTGVLESIDKYIEQVRYFSPFQILDYQRNGTIYFKDTRVPRTPTNQGYDFQQNNYQAPSQENDLEKVKQLKRNPSDFSKR